MRTKERLARHMSFLHKRSLDVKYGLGVFKKGIVINNNLHEEKCNRLFIQMSGSSILFNHNLWFKAVEIKIKYELL
jgi:hypothetical protein